MDEKRKGEIAWVLLKGNMAKNLRLADIANLRREIGNASKETGIPQDELLEFAQLIVREIFEDQIKGLKSRVKVLD